MASARRLFVQLLLVSLPALARQAVSKARGALGRDKHEVLLRLPRGVRLAHLAGGAAAGKATARLAVDREKKNKKQSAGFRGAGGR